MPGLAKDEEASSVRRSGSITGSYSLRDGINRERKKAGLSSLIELPTLVLIARARCLELLPGEYFGHVDLSGASRYYDLLKLHGVMYSWAGENLAKNNYPDSESADRALASLMKSPTHRENILFPEYTHAGTAHVVSPDGMHFFCTIFVAQFQWGA